MALRQSNAVYTAYQVASLSIAPQAIYSFNIKGIYVLSPSVAVQYATISIDQVTLGVFRTGQGGFNMLDGHIPNTYPTNIVQLMISKGYFKGYPVQANQHFTVSLSAGTGVIIIEYDIYDPTDMKSDMPNGSTSKERYYVLLGTNGGIIPSNGYMPIDTSNLIPQFTKFPWGEPVPADKTFTIYSIFGRPVQYNNWDGTLDHYAQTTYLRFNQETTQLFGLDQIGFLFFGQSAAAGSINVSYSDGYCYVPWINPSENSPILFLDNPVVLTGGTKITVDVGVTYNDGTATILANQINVGLIIKDMMK